MYYGVSSLSSEIIKEALDSKHLTLKIWEHVTNQFWDLQYTIFSSYQTTNLLFVQGCERGCFALLQKSSACV